MLAGLSRLAITVTWNLKKDVKDKVDKCGKD